MEMEILSSLEEQREIVELLTIQNGYLYYIHGYLLFLTIVVLCVLIYRFFSAIFRY